MSIPEMSAINCEVPLFVAPMTSEMTFDLATYREKKIVLYFYPKDNTPGCTTESANFRDIHNAILDCNAVLFGVSRDSLKSHENFKSKLGLPFELISDPDETLCTLFNVIKMKNMYGKQVRGIERSTFIIDEKGVLVKEWRGVRVNTHAQEVLEYLQK